MAMKPTERQLEKFWGYFGFKYWGRFQITYPDGSIHDRPELTLDNLVDYAVPRVSEKSEIRFRVGCPFINSLHCEIWTHLPSGNTQQYEYDLHSVPDPTARDYALALFYTIDRVIEERGIMKKEKGGQCVNVKSQ